VGHWKAAGLDLHPILAQPALAEGAALRRTRGQRHGLEAVLDRRLIELSAAALADGTPVREALAIRNTDRTTGTMLGSEVTRRFGGKGLPDDTIELTFTGTAGQSFGAFLPRGVTLRLFGDANDYVGKGLSGGRLVVRPDARAPFVAEENVIAGNTVLYGATAGELYLRGRVGERFAVRNSGAVAVVEGVGDHGCEYMTGGTVVVLGSTGRNFAAGMSGGIAYAYRLDPVLVNKEQVELEPLSTEDRRALRDLVERHRAETASPLADRLLADWRAAAEQFTKVMPRDYKRVLEAVRTAEADGRDVDTAIMEVANA
jgi:glutamate synthase (NADPH/NADH) large chain